MKTCPICKARCFDDMEICYGCMHRFDEVEPRRPPVEDATEIAEMPLRPAAAHEGREAPPPRRIRERREPPRVFGARDEEEFMWDAPGFSEGATVRLSPALQMEGAAMPMPPLELMPGPLAVASLPNGYRLVVSIERA